MDKKIYRVPARFYYDHESRDLPSGEVIRHLSNGKLEVSLDADSMEDLLDDARFYVEMAPELGRDLFGLVSSARATVRALTREEAN